MRSPLWLFVALIVLACVILGARCSAARLSLSNHGSPKIARNSASSSSALDYSKWKGKRALFIGAHPDDIVGTTGGLVHLMTKQGTNVSFVIVTNGDKGCSSPICKNWTSEQIAARRYQEAKESAAVVGVPSHQVYLLDFEDCMVTTYPEVQILRLLVQYIRLIRPQVLMSWYPYPNFQMSPAKGWDDLGFHPDHQAVGRLTLAAHFDAGVDRTFPEAGKGFSVPEFYMWSFIAPKLYVNLTKEDIDVQIEAYLKHKTQYPNREEVERSVHKVAALVASTTGHPDVHSAEGFLPFF